MFRAEQRAEAEYAVRARAFAIAVARGAGRAGLRRGICMRSGGEWLMNSEQRGDAPALEAARASDVILIQGEDDEARGDEISRVWRDDDAATTTRL